MFDPRVLLIAALLAGGYLVVEKVREPIHKAGHAICHVVTFGAKCDEKVKDAAQP